MPSTSSSFRLVSLLCVALSLWGEVGTEDGKMEGLPTAVCSKGFCCSSQYLKQAWDMVQLVVGQLCD